MLGLGQTRLFDKAVSNMGIMDISELRPMLQAVYELLRPGGSFVFSTHHPCFERPADKYMTSCVHEREAIQRQPVPQFYYHRPLQRLFEWCFEAGFVLDGFYENTDRDNEPPVIFIARLRKPKGICGYSRSYIWKDRGYTKIQNNRKTVK